MEGEPTTWKRRQQDVHIDINNNTNHSTNTDDNHNTCDTSDEDSRPAKRCKQRLALAATLTTSRKNTLKLHVGQRGPLVTLSAATLKINDAQP